MLVTIVSIVTTLSHRPVPPTHCIQSRTYPCTTTINHTRQSQSHRPTTPTPINPNPTDQQIGEHPLQFPEGDAVLALAVHGRLQDTGPGLGHHVQVLPGRIGRYSVRLSTGPGLGHHIQVLPGRIGRYSVRLSTGPGLGHHIQVLPGRL